MSFDKSYEKLLCWAILLVPALLLTTNNFSIAIIVISIIFSIIYLYINWNKIHLTRFDSLVILCMSFYFIGAIPVTVYDSTTARYFQGGIRLILCLPIYLALRTLLNDRNIRLRNYLEIGVILGCVGTFVFACYQKFILEMYRVEGYLFSINFGYLACALMFLALTFSFTSKSKKLLLIGSIVCSTSVIFTYTRAVIFAIPILLTITALLNLDHIKKRHILVTTITLVLISLTFYNTSNYFKQRVNYTIQETKLIVSGNLKDSTSSISRIHYWYGAFEAFKSSPLIGTTYSQREKINHQLFLDGKVNKESSLISRGHAHNQYFEMMASNGILGIISIFTIFVFPAIIFIHHSLRYKCCWASSAAVFVCSFAIFGLTEVPLTANLIGSFYGFMLAVFFAVIASEKHNNSVT